MLVFLPMAERGEEGEKKDADNSVSPRVNGRQLEVIMFRVGGISAS